MSGRDAGHAHADDTVRIDVVRGTPTDEELAALIAVVSEEYAHEEASASAADTPSRSIWELAARRPTPTLRRDVRWGRYAG